MIWTDILGSVANIADDLITTDEERAKANNELVKIAQVSELAHLDADTKLALGQIDINKADAAGASPMQRNWRPMIGWVCAVALAWDTIGKPVAVFGMTIAGQDVPALPSLSTDQLYGLLFSMLGLGGYRTYEKTRKP